MSIKTALDAAPPAIRDSFHYWLTQRRPGNSATSIAARLILREAGRRRHPDSIHAHIDRMIDGEFALSTEQRQRYHLILRTLVEMWLEGRPKIVACSDKREWENLPGGGHMRRTHIDDPEDKQGESRRSDTT
jgi:hypothetical protein